MKLILVTMLTVFALGAQALDLGDILPIIIGGGNHGHPGGYPGQPYPGNPGYGGGGVTCKSTDNGWEEHPGGHYSCGECLQQHGDCTETCSSVMAECQINGTDRYGQSVNFIGRGYDQWSAQSDGIRACQYNYAANCVVVGCNQRENIVSRRSCRR